MGRKSRIEYPGAFYHVYARGNRRLSIFKDDEDRRRFLQKLGGYKECYGFALYAHTLMDNHFHLLVETGDIALSLIMQVLLQSHTRFYNRKYRVVGHLFQARYKAILCDRDAYLLALVRYLHLNCVRAGIVTDPAKYRWSSHRAYLGLDKSNLVDTELVLSKFSKSRAQAIKLYRDFVMEWKDVGNLTVFYQVVDQRILGEDDFVAKVKKKVGEEHRSEESIAKNKTLKEVAKAVERVMGVSLADLQSHKRGEQLNKARSLFVQLCILYVPVKRKEIARFLRRESGSLAKIERNLTQEEFSRLRKRMRW
jgi:putative transposase